MTAPRRRRARAPGCSRRRRASWCSSSSCCSRCSSCSGSTRPRPSRRWPTTPRPGPPAPRPHRSRSSRPRRARASARSARRPRSTWDVDDSDGDGVGRHGRARGGGAAAPVHPAVDRGIDRARRGPSRRARPGRAGAHVTLAACRGDAGQVGGIEALPFGLLDLRGRRRCSSPTRGRSSTRSSPPTRPLARRCAPSSRATTRPTAVGTRSPPGSTSIEGHGRDPDRATVAAGGRRVARAVRAGHLRGGVRDPGRSRSRSSAATDSAPFRVRSTHSELVDPFRSGVPGSAEACP